jgi:hypothetical protein
MTDYALKPFEELYENYIINTKPIETSSCKIGNNSAHEVSEYLLDELFKNVIRFRSDFLLDWVNIANTVKAMKPNQTKLFVMAFRENGVDGYNYIGLRAENGQHYFDEFYGNKKIFMIACTSNESEVTINLYNIYDAIINNFNMFKEYINTEFDKS